MPDIEIPDEINALDTEIQDIRGKTSLGGEEIGRRLTPLYEKKAELLSRQREAEKPERDAEWKRAVEEQSTPPEVAATIAEVKRMETERGEDPEENDRIITEYELELFGGDQQRLYDFIVQNNLHKDPEALADARQFILNRARKRKK